MTTLLIQIRDTAFNILARREHSEQELIKKLLVKFKDESENIMLVIKELQNDNIQDDDRFAASFLRSKIVRRHGKNRIINELKQKGVHADSIEYAFQSEPDIDWFKLAKDLKESKFGKDIATEYKQKAKQCRYLQYRGFSFDEINYAIRDNTD